MPVFIGDVHGKFGAYGKIIKKHRDTIQVGDMGMGFRRWPHGEWDINPPYDKMVETNAQFIRGNHDNPGACRNHSQCIKDGRVVTGKFGPMMFIGGGYSIDHAYRIKDYSWWEDEELSQEDMFHMAQVYEMAKPRIMVTHECPTTTCQAIYSSHHNQFPPSRTQQFLQVLWENNGHKPQIWVHGHHHQSVDHVIEGTRFVCLAELEVKEIS